MSPRARTDHTENEKRGMRDTFKLNAMPSLTSRRAGLYTEIVPTKRLKLVRELSGMSGCARQCCSTHMENCKGKLLVKE